MNYTPELKTKLNKISVTLPVSLLLNQKMDQGYINNYYLKNKWTYKLFHSTTDSYHMAISPDGI